MTSSTSLVAAFGVGTAAIAMHGMLAQEAFAQERRSIETQFVDRAGEVAGKATLRDSSEGVLIEAEVSGLPAGDMPNQHVGEEGVLCAQIFNSFVRLGEGEADIVGRALMVHAGSDDYESQATGEAGERLACAVVA